MAKKIQFDIEAREGLKAAAKFNGVPKKVQDKLGRMKFDIERVKAIREEMMESGTNKGDDLDEINSVIER